MSTGVPFNTAHLRERGHALIAWARQDESLAGIGVLMCLAADEIDQLEGRGKKTASTLCDTIPESAFPQSDWSWRQTNFIGEPADARRASP